MDRSTEGEATVATRPIAVYASGYPHLFSSRRMWSTAFMSEEVRASVRRSREGAVCIVEEHAQGGRTRTAFCAEAYRELHGSSLPVAESRGPSLERFPETASPTSTEVTTGGSLWV